MDRLEQLIGKLKEQFEQNAENAELLKTTQLIEQELQLRHVKEKNIPTSRVSVVMPSGSFLAETAINEEKTVEKPEEEIKPNVKIAENEIAPIEKMPDPLPVNNNPAWLYDPIHEVPTMASQETIKDLNDLIGARHASINDRLKTETRELGQSLTEVPVRDLKKAIGINDRFVFVNELFRGDETMYERSLKTINDFKIYPEAEYWIERELKVKLGWDEGSEVVNDFYRVVRRRFL